MARLSQLFSPKGDEFFSLFEEAGANNLKAAELLEQMLDRWPEHGELGREVVACEQVGDRVTYSTIQRLNSSFVTPIDREDIYALAGALDDVVDFIEEAADFLSLYQIEKPMEQAQRLSRTLTGACREIAQAMPLLRSLGDINQFTKEVNRLENEGDRIIREALASLFSNGLDPVDVIKWKDILERIEDGIDATDTVAHILEGIVIKNS